MRLRIIILACLMIVGCSRTSTLNLKPHIYGKKATKIIWLQVAGLSEEHMAMLRFSYTDATKTTAFENLQCSGKTWSFNLYSIRPTAYDSFLSQILGSKNIKGNCSDYEKKPIWDFLSAAGYQIGVFESGVNKENSLLKSLACEQKKPFVDNISFWQMRKGEGESFHYQGRKPFEQGRVYYDKSCQIGNCYTGLFNNVKSVWERYRKDRAKVMFMIRDFSYLAKLEKKNIAEAREVLGEIDKVLSYFQDFRDRKEDILILLSSARSQNLEFPARGKEWADFEKGGKFVFYRKTSLLSPVFAMGPGSENFCGIYEEASLVKRILWIPEGQISPFKSIR